MAHKDSPLPSPVFISMAEAAHSLGIGRTTLELMWRRGEIKTKTIGARRLVLASEIERIASEASAVDLAAIPSEAR